MDDTVTFIILLLKYTSSKKKNATTDQVTVGGNFGSDWFRGWWMVVLRTHSILKSRI